MGVFEPTRSRAVFRRLTGSDPLGRGRALIEAPARSARDSAALLVLGGSPARAPFRAAVSLSVTATVDGFGRHAAPRRPPRAAVPQQPPTVGGLTPSRPHTLRVRRLRHRAPTDEPLPGRPSAGRREHRTESEESR